MPVLSIHKLYMYLSLHKMCGSEKVVDAVYKEYTEFFCLHFLFFPTFPPISPLNMVQAHALNIFFPLQMKEWLCLTCQMQRALTAAESVEPPSIKPQTSPNKVSTPAPTQEEPAANQKKDTISTHKADMPGKTQKDSPTTSEPQNKKETIPSSQKDITLISTTASSHSKETPPTPSVLSQEAEAESPRTKEVPTSSATLTSETTTVASPAVTDIGSAPQKKMDLTPPSSPATKKETEMEEKKDKMIEKSDKQVVGLSDEGQPKQALNKESNHVETSLANSTPPEAKTTNQDLGGVLGFGSPKSKHDTSKTAEAVTGKMFGFGSSIFSSASSLINAVQEEARITPPTSRKMSAPANVSRKMSASQISPKSSPPASPSMPSVKESKPVAAQKPQLEKMPDKPQQAKGPPSGQAKLDTAPSETPKEPATSKPAFKVDQSACPLCKGELNVGSKEPPNYNTCTECKNLVCSKCGFSPMPNVAEVIKNQKSNLSYNISIGRICNLPLLVFILAEFWK